MGDLTCHRDTMTPENEQLYATDAKKGTAGAGGAGHKQQIRKGKQLAGDHFTEKALVKVMQDAVVLTRVLPATRNFTQNLVTHHHFREGGNPVT